MNEINKDFLDYRAYVSHTLCKHRLFLGWRLRARRGIVWRMRACGPWWRMKRSGCWIWQARFTDCAAPDWTRQLVTPAGAGNHAFGGRRIASQGISRNFQGVPGGGGSSQRDARRHVAIVRGGDPEFSSVRVDAYLAGRSSADCLESFLEEVRNRVLPVVKAVFAGGSAGSEGYRRFWPVASDAFVLTRAALVAGFLHGFGPVAEPGIHDLQRRLRRIERVISCWSPGIPETSRDRAIQQTLLAEGYASTDAILVEMEALAK